MNENVKFEIEVIKLLKELGFRQELLGFDAIVKSMLAIKQSNTLLYNHRRLFSKLEPELSCKAERAIRNSLYDTALKNKDKLIDLCGENSFDNAPTISVFLTSFYYKLKEKQLL